MACVEPIRDLPIQYTQLFINNQFVNAKTGRTFATTNPATGQEIAKIQEAGPEDINDAVAAAKAAFAMGSKWRTMDPSVRGALLYKLGDLIERDHQILATLECIDVGKPYAHVFAEISNFPKLVRYFAGWTDKICGSTVPVDGDYFTYTRIEPVGVVGAIVPWNFPLMVMLMKIGPAIAAGCTMVIKPAEQTPLSALHIGKLVAEAGFPPGVINIVPGFGPTAGATLTAHQDVDKITFTGSTAVGRLIMKAAADSNLKKVTLELGGKSPNIVFADADLDYAVEMSHFAVMFNMGQVCTAGSRTYVQEEIYDKFVEKAVERAKRRVVGDPFDTKTEHGPQINEDQFNKILSLIDSGKQEGAKLQCGGQRHGDKGYFIQPTVFSDVCDEMRIAKEEIFGPVQQIIKFRTIDEVIPRANNSKYGLAAAVFTKDIDKALTIAHTVQAGTVWVNCYLVLCHQAPFGGYKESGIGRENAEEGIKEYCEIKTVVIKLPPKVAK